MRTVLQSLFSSLLFRRIAAFTFVSGLLFLGTTSTAYAQVYFGWDINLPQASPLEVIIAIINFALGLLSLVAVIILLYGGFVWMLSGGSEEKIEKAKLILRNGLIGLALVLSAWAITTLILNLLIDFTDVQDTPPYVPPTCEESGNCPNDSPFYISHTNPKDEETNVPLCHIVAVTFSFPVDDRTVTPETFKVTIPEDQTTNPTGGRAAGASCDNGKQCLSGACEASACVGDQVAGTFDFSEERYAAVFYPSADYFENTTYRVLLDTAIQGSSPETGALYSLSPGDPKRSFRFSTGTETDEIPPTVNVQSLPPFPVDGATEICRNPNLLTSFSESLDPASVKSTNIWLYKAGDGISPSDELDVTGIRLNSLGGEADDTVVTRPKETLEANTAYGMNLYSGDATADANFEGAIRDACGNPLSGNFDATPQGSPTDDFVDQTSAGMDQAYCACLTADDICPVAVGGTSCTVAGGATCNLSSACSSTSKDYVGFDYQWTWQTGETLTCNPEITSVIQSDQFYSRDLDNAAGTGINATGMEDTGRVVLDGTYLFPFQDIYFSNNIGTANDNCFGPTNSPTLSCFISNYGTTRVTVRTPVASRTGKVTVDSGTIKGQSVDLATILSPYITHTSPAQGPVGQYVTIKGANFIDHNPEDATSQIGHVFFDDIEAAIMCADGWDDKQIIVQVPEGFEPGDTPLVQVTTRDSGDVTDERNNLYSNQRLFTITDGSPGPGICLLDPDSSDTGEEDVNIIGENFGTEVEKKVYFDPNNGPYVEGAIRNWDVLNSTYGSQSVVTNSTPVRNHDIYDVTVANADGISNGLDYKIPRTEPPRMFDYGQCRVDVDAVYLPNPVVGTENACVNNDIVIAFTADMNLASVRQNVEVRRCNVGYNQDGTINDFDSTTCTTVTGGTWTEATLGAAYLGGAPGTFLDGSRDVDGDGSLDHYEEFTFSPTNKFEAAHYYQVSVSDLTASEAGVTLESSRSWNFLVRNSAVDCVADSLALGPVNQTVNRYEVANRCPNNYSKDGEDYTMRARQFTSDCSLLRDEATYRWSIVDDPANHDVAQFGTDQQPSQGKGITSDILTNTGYQNVCVQGEAGSNTGTANVRAVVLNPETGADGPHNDAAFRVDYGYCTTDADCYTNQCQDTFCDLTTNHCTPDIISFTPNNSADEDTTNDATADVGPLGCVSINGCYFGADRVNTATCTCNSVVKPGLTCDVLEGSSKCLLPDLFNTCSVGEQLCTLTSACTPSSADAVFSDDGGLIGCGCSAANGNECSVLPGKTTCVVEGVDGEVCSPTTPGYVTPQEGNVYFNDDTSDYPSGEFCGDTWNTKQVIAQVPEDLDPGDYTLKLESSSINRLTGAHLTDEFTEEDCKVGDATTPCLCRLDPAIGKEGSSVDLFGYGFDSLNEADRKVTFKTSPVGRLVATVDEWIDDNAIDNAKVPRAAVSADEGVQVEDSSIKSNALDFTVSCKANLDCSSGCCAEGQCKSPEYCNACQSDLDCQSGSCKSTCVEGQCAPFVTEISPKQGAVGQPVTVQGCYFGAYYAPTSGTAPYSKVTFDGIQAPMACNLTDSWRNTRIVVSAPDGIFEDASPETAQVVVTQVTNNRANSKTSLEAFGTADPDGDGLTGADDANPNDANNDGTPDAIDPSHPATFNIDNSCSAVDIPVLCNIDEGYGAKADPVTLEGKNFYGENDGYCTCETESLGECVIDQGANSCSVNKDTTFFVNNDDHSEVCSVATVNSTTTYNPTTAKCDYVKGNDTCSILVGATSCTNTVSQNCTLPVTCGESGSGFISQSGAASFSRNQAAAVDWTTAKINPTDSPNSYDTTVPTKAQTGNTSVASVLADGQQCVSNGIQFPVTCNVCGDCADPAGTENPQALNCNNQTNGDLPPGVGFCTQNTSGFCRASAGFGCCNTTSCVYDSTVAGTVDGGTCVPQPVVTISNPSNNADQICPNTALRVTFDQTITVSDIYSDILAAHSFDPGGPGDPCQIDAASEACATYTEELSSFIPTSDQLKQYIRIVKEGSTPEQVIEIDQVILSQSQTELIITQKELLDINATYRIEITGQPTVLAGAKSQTGIVSKSNGAAVYCSPDQIAAGMCDTSGKVAISFTTVPDQQTYNDNCGPSRATLEGTNPEFVNADYTYIRKNQREIFETKVFAAGIDKDSEDDDQEIVRIKDGVGAGFDWTYDWDDSIMFDSLTDLATNSCPVVGIITGGATSGSCSCDLSETCDINSGAESCETPSGISCVTDSPDGTCSELDSNYDPDTQTCGCAVGQACTVTEGQSSCDLTINETDASCELSAACSAGTTGFRPAGFTEDTAIQAVTADSTENTSAVEVAVRGDGSPEQGWSGDREAGQPVHVLFCASYASLVSFSNDLYDIYWAYCRGANPQAKTYLPRFEPTFERFGSLTSTTDPIDVAYGKPQDFIYEVAFKDVRALTNDTNANNNTIAIRVYNNDLDDDRDTVLDSVDAGLWYSLQSNNNAPGAAGTLDGYQSFDVGNTTYTSFAVLDEAGTRRSSYRDLIKPMIGVLAFSAEAEASTSNVIRNIKQHFLFNNTTSLVRACKVEKQKITNDTKRINNLGAMSYALSSYYYNDSDANGTKDFPTVETGSYIPRMTNSLWPSWNSTLGNVLGQNMPKDPINTFNDAANTCPFNPPNLSEGDDPSSSEWTYYDKTGTCWDPTLKDFKGPANSHVYLYQSKHDAVDFQLYGNLEYTDHYWRNNGPSDVLSVPMTTAKFNPCRRYAFNQAVPASVSQSSDNGHVGCSTFNVATYPSATTFNAAYRANFE